MNSRVWWGVLGLFGFAVILTLLFLWRESPNQITDSPPATPGEAPSKGIVSEVETIPRTSASLTPSQIYREALQADDASKRAPTWEEMNRDRPAEF